MAKKKTINYTVRRWVHFPAFWEVEASTPQEARKKSYELTMSYLKNLGISETSPIEEGDAVVAVHEDGDVIGKVVLYSYSDTEV